MTQTDKKPVPGSGRKRFTRRKFLGTAVGAAAVWAG
ncbi:twin-arginine translocation signal domain-containing protein [Pandoraea sputorum]